MKTLNLEEDRDKIKLISDVLAHEQTSIHVKEALAKLITTTLSSISEELVLDRLHKAKWHIENEITRLESRTLGKENQV